MIDYGTIYLSRDFLEELDNGENALVFMLKEGNLDITVNVTDSQTEMPVEENQITAKETVFEWDKSDLIGIAGNTNSGSKNVTIIKDGDIVSIDLVILKNGYNGDAARTYLIGECSEDKKHLLKVTEQAFWEGLKFCKPGYRVGDIGNAVAQYCWDNGCDVIREFQGHGIGKEMHEDPGVPNYGKPGRGMRLEPGMTICVEPMVVAGKPDIWELDDGWTIATQDGSMSAHYENTILITNDEPKILTLK